MLNPLVAARLLGVGACAVALLGQTAPANSHGGFVVSDPHPFIYDLNATVRPDLRYSAAEQKFGRGTFDPLAEPLLRAAERFSAAVFSVSGMDFQRAVTYADEKGDRFVAQWSINTPAGTGWLILDDTADRSYFHFRLTDSRISTSSDVDRLVSSILVTDQPPANVVLSRSATRLYENAAGLYGFSWAFDPKIPSPQPWLRELSLMGVTDGKDWFLTVTAGKMLTLHDYPEEPFIPERFPPLPDRVKTWSSDRIRSELSKPPRPNVPDNREGVLLTELARRGLSAEEVIDLLESAAPSWERQRLQRVQFVLERAPKPIHVSAYFDQALRIYEQAGGRAEGAVEGLFLSASASCAPQFDASALRLLREGVLMSGPLDYLGKCASSPEMLQVLESLTVPESVKASWELAVASARRRTVKGPRPSRPTVPTAPPLD